MMDGDDLVKRLRDLVNDDDTEMLAWQAADRIEQLEAALDDVATHLPRAEWHYLKDETLITIGEKKDDK
jgi:hypothetical protein